MHVQGWKPQKPTKLDGKSPQHFHTILTSCAILLPLTQIYFVFVSCVQRRVVEGNGVGVRSSGCVASVF